MTNSLANPVADSFQGINPATGQPLPGLFQEATVSEVAQACERAAEAFSEYRKKSGAEKARFLEQIATEIEALGDELLTRAQAESGLPLARLTGERGRTTGQLRLFADYLREGSWVDARIDTALPDRQPLPRPDLRQMLRPLGPVGVFGASNFPLAFSVAGGDTASALAAGCPVVVKGHPAHPGTSQLVGDAISRAVKACGLPAGTFSLVQGRTTAVGMAIVEHPAIKAVGFTGSWRGGKALFDAAARRPEPIPVYAEMGSTNPVFFLPQLLKEKGSALAQSFVGSITLGVGQFCTNPGMAVVQQSSDADTFMQAAAQGITNSQPATMLTQGIQRAFTAGIDKLTAAEGVDVLGQATAADSFANGTPTLLKTSAEALLANPVLAEEVFGPSSVLVEAGGREQLLAVARGLEGHLTATVWGTDAELLEYADLLEILEQKVGRLLINGFPTGVEVSHAMQHGGPYPATTDSRSTSVGTNAILRFARPVCYQNFPDALLPDELKAANPLHIWRLVDGKRVNA
ncbi:aldehyde dehydrogenase (NADP(+)) [Spirosoma sp. KCTC 42546]|uniref:aldehyde dehydrogenase (NADP(+)) n=1 Tax=Spirosoma sp. KCTC 42546 TaxID=2520506 RepID=UPI001159723F|nr:aldehyde dehydrogenase (NADP(+)) [Spirosoma sp. KCTC 42546]QDK78453.1 aldehyde dehydrogenase (NADP(+)) [Spirosoma sp. KCTC 42546]